MPVSLSNRWLPRGCPPFTDAVRFISEIMKLLSTAWLRAVTTVFQIAILEESDRSSNWMQPVSGAPGTPDTSFSFLPGHETQRLVRVRRAFHAAGRGRHERHPVTVDDEVDHTGRPHLGPAASGQRHQGDDERIGSPQATGELVVGRDPFASFGFRQCEIDAVVDSLFRGNRDLHCPNQQR